MLFGLCLLLSGGARAGELEVYPDVAPTPALMLRDLGDRPHSLDEYRGRVVLVNFWASWCAPCLIEMPGIQRLKESLAGQPFTVLAVNFKETRATVWRFRKLLQVDFPLLLDANGQAAADWQVAVYPTTYLVGTDGRIRYVAYGQLKWDDPAIKRTIEDMLSEPAGTGTEGGDLLPVVGTE